MPKPIAIIAGLVLTLTIVACAHISGPIITGSTLALQPPSGGAACV